MNQPHVYNRVLVPPCDIKTICHWLWARVTALTQQRCDPWPGLGDHREEINCRVITLVMKLKHNLNLCSRPSSVEPTAEMSVSSWWSVGAASINNQLLLSPVWNKLSSLPWNTKSSNLDLHCLTLSTVSSNFKVCFCWFSECKSWYHQQQHVLLGIKKRGKFWS